MNKLASQFLNFHKLMGDTMDLMSSDNERDNEMFYSTMFKLSMSRTDGKCGTIDFVMCPEIWEGVQDFLSDYVEVILDNYGEFTDDPDVEMELIREFGLDYVATETDYNQASDITYIFEVTYSKGKEVKRTLKGFYYGEPNTEDTSSYYESLTAQFS